MIDENVLRERIEKFFYAPAKYTEQQGSYQTLLKWLPEIAASTSIEPVISEAAGVNPPTVKLAFAGKGNVAFFVNNEKTWVDCSTPKSIREETDIAPERIKYWLSFA